MVVFRKWSLHLHDGKIILFGMTNYDMKIQKTSYIISGKDSCVSSDVGSYKLVGTMDKYLRQRSDCPEWFLDKFINGFPLNWKELLKDKRLESVTRTRYKSNYFQNMEPISRSANIINKSIQSKKKFKIYEENNEKFSDLSDFKIVDCSVVLNRVSNNTINPKLTESLNVKNKTKSVKENSKIKKKIPIKEKAQITENKICKKRLKSDLKKIQKNLSSDKVDEKSKFIDISNHSMKQDLFSSFDSFLNLSDVEDVSDMNIDSIIDKDSFLSSGGYFSDPFNCSSSASSISSPEKGSLNDVEFPLSDSMRKRAQKITKEIKTCTKRKLRFSSPKKTTKKLKAPSKNWREILQKATEKANCLSDEEDEKNSSYEADYEC